MESKIFKSHQCSLERSYAILIEINFDQGFALFLKKSYPYRSTSHKNLQKQNNKDFFIQLFCGWPHLTNSNLPAPISIEEILDQIIF